jgi:hypothetical protein
VIAEHVEKLFACYLRLPQLSKSDLAEAVELLAGIELRKMNEEEIKKAKTAVAEAERRRKEAEESLEELKNPSPPVPLNEDGPSRYQPPFQSRIKMGIDFVPMTGDEQRKVKEQNERSKQWHEGWSKLTVEQRHAQKPEVQREYEQSRAAETAAQGRLESLENANRPSEIPRGPSFTSADVRFNESEIEAIKEKVPQLFANWHRRAGPRAVRTLLFKIQLCRLLLQLRKTAGEGDQVSVEGIIAAFSKDTKQDRPNGRRESIETIVGQVI